jgi:hypothetical protein
MILAGIELPPTRRQHDTDARCSVVQWSVNGWSASSGRACGEQAAGTGEGFMRIVVSLVRALIVAIGAAGLATAAGTIASAQTTLLNVYEQAASNTCTKTPGCRVDFATVTQNLKVLRVSCLIDIQSNGVNSLISDFELGNASSDQSSYSFGQYLAPLQLLGATGTDQFYISDAEALHVVPAGMRPSVFIFTRINPSAPIAAQCSISGTFLSN